MKHIQLWHRIITDTSQDLPHWNDSALATLRKRGFFTLKTCQRVILVQRAHLNEINDNERLKNFEYLNGAEAYQFILETICGLKSRLVGETEIVSQFKDSFEEYLKTDQRDSMLIKVFQKIFMDAKKIRSEHLQKIGLLSYCGFN